MNFLPESTLAYYEALPHKQRMALGQSRKVAKFSSATSQYMESCGKVIPDVEALEFYALNHYYSLVQARFTPNEKLPEWAVWFAQMYSDCLTRQAKRLMHYMFCIVTREARHLHKFSESEPLHQKILEIGGPDMLAFLKAIQGNNETAAVESYKSSPPDVLASQYVRGIEAAFDYGKWSSGYGGKPWGQIARTLAEWLDGKTSIEMMVDTAYTLAHNNGPMFNKGMMYHMYTDSFKAILDVQRGGMIPALIRNKSKISYVKTMKLDNLEKVNTLAFQHFGDELLEEVDWAGLKDLGAIGNYSHMAPKKPKEPEVKPAPNKPNMPHLAVYGGKPAKHVGEFHVLPGQTAKILERI